MSKTKTSAIAFLITLLSYTNFNNNSSRNNENHDILHLQRKINQTNIFNEFTSNTRNAYQDFTPKRLVYHEIIPRQDKEEFYPEKIYVFMLNAGPNVENTEGYERFRQNIDVLYKSFSSTFNIPKENFVVLQGGPKKEYTNGKATFENVAKSMENLRDKITNNDLLITIVTNHGTGRINDNLYCLDDFELISGKTLRAMYSNSDAGAIISYYFPCGGFISAAKPEPNEISVSVSGPGMNTDGREPKNLAKTINMLLTKKGFSEIDINKDNKISFYELQTYSSLSNDSTNPERLSKNPNNDTDWRREVHHVNYRNYDPKKVILKTKRLKTNLHRYN